MIDWLKIYGHLLPRARSWRLVIDRKLRQFFDGLTDLPDGVVNYQDDLWSVHKPQETSKLSEWEQQFALPNTPLTEQERRDRLDATWKALGGQDPRYIQDTLQAAGFDVYVHEWWVPTSRATGGSVNGDDTPVARNPFTYLWDGVSQRKYIGSGHDLAYCGGDSAFSNSQVDPPGYPLVNKTSSEDTVYVIPADPTKYPYFLYIGAATFPETANIPAARKNEFEQLCLKISPAEQWLGILVTYS